jgi:prevent-host-death family protein
MTGSTRGMSLMKTVSIEEAKADLERLLEEAAKGEPFIVSREGKTSLLVIVSEATEDDLQQQNVPDPA